MTLFKKISKRRIISFILAMSLIFTVFAIPMPTGADTLSELENQYKELEKERTQIQENYQDTINQKQDKEEYSSMLEQQISSTMQQLDILIFRIEVLDNDIAALEKEIAEKEKEIDECYELYKDRVRAIYMSGQTGMLEFLLDSNSLGDFYDRFMMAKSVSEHDNEMMDQLKNDKEELEAKKQQIEQNRADISRSKTEQEAKSAELDRLYEENNQIIAQLMQNEEYALKERQRKDQEMAEVNAEIEKAYEEIERQKQEEANQSGGILVYPEDNGNNGSDNIFNVVDPESGRTEVIINGAVSSKGFQWPCPELSLITSGYKPSDRGYAHNGIDIAGAGSYGTPIVATRSGTVSLVADHGDKSYGKFVMIDHGYIDGKHYVTLYGHCSKLYVSEGQKVQQGQQIAAVGSTGDSTGPHCHFEVRVDGKFTNPISYF